MYADLDLTEEVAKTSIDYYVDGETQKSAPFAITKNGNDKDEKFGGNGVVLEAYKQENDKGEVTGVTLVAINTFYDEIDDVTTNSDKERIVKIGSKEFVTSEFAEDDSVIYTQDLDAGNKADYIQTMAATEKLTGTLTKIKGDDYTIGGTTYTLNANCNTFTGDVKDDVDFYLDTNGYIIHIETSDEDVNLDNLAYVEEIGNSRGYYAVLRLADGSKKTVDLDKEYSDYIDHIVSFKVNSDGDYKLTDKATYDETEYVFNAKGTTAKFEKGKPTMTVTTTSETGSKNTSFKTDSKTAFVYATTDKSGDTSYKTYTGYKVAASIMTSAKAAADVNVVSAYVKDGVAVLVYVDMSKTSIGTTAADLTFIAYDDGAKEIDEGDDVVYYELNAVVDGKITTVKVNKDVYDQIAKDADKTDELVVAYAGLTYNSDDIAEDVTPADVTKGNLTVKALKNDMIQIDGAAYAFTDDATVFFADGCDITAGTASDIREDDNKDKDPYKQVVFHTDDGDIDVIVLVKD